MDNILLFLPTDKPLVMIAIGLVLLIVIVGIVKALFRMALIVAVVGAIAIFFFGLSPGDVFEKGKQLTEQSAQIVTDQLNPLILEQIETAEYEKGKDGAFSLKNEDFELSYSKDKEVRMRIKSLDLNFTLEELSKYVSKEEMETIMNKIQEKKVSE